MCGIFGYVGPNDNAISTVRAGLKRLEYRGYDSWGIAFPQETIEILKEVGRIPTDLEAPSSSIALGHTRWATHGGVTKVNAHPHLSSNKKIAVVHNGIVENFEKLILKYDLDMDSDTDSEVIPHLIEYFMEQSYTFEESVRLTLAELDGTFGIVALCVDQKELIVARMGSPIIIGELDEGYVVSSDIPALLSHTKKVVILNDGELAILNGDFQLKNFYENKPLTPKFVTIDWDIETAEKSGYKHFMFKEIMEQPQSIEKTLQGRIVDNLPHLPELNALDPKRIIILGCGTSWHAGIVGEFMLEGLARIPVEVEYASEFRYRNPIIEEGTLVIAISQSGETADTLAALREAKKKGAKVLSICNVMESTIPRESEVTIYTRAGPEMGVASTKAFVTQLSILYLITAHYAMKNKSLPSTKITEMCADILKLPELFTDLLIDTQPYLDIAKEYFESRNALFLGRGIHYPIALEGALKLKEISYIHAEGYPAAEMKHGPIALIDVNMPSFFIAMKDSHTYGKVVSNMQEVKARGGKIIAIATKGDTSLQALADHIIFLPSTRYMLSAFLATIPMQLLSYYIADLRECDIDKPRNLAKSVTVE